ncbi:hypothetical protein D3C86_1536510 [compost metagenome]
MERRIAQDRTQAHWRGIDAVTGNHLGFQSIGRQGQTTAGSGKGIHIQQRDLVVRVTTFHCRPQNPCTATEIEQVTARQFVQMLQQQRTAAIQATMAEHPRQADDLQRAFGQRQFVGLRQAFQRFGFRRVGHGDQPELAVARAVEFAWLAERVELFGGTFDAAFFLADQVQLAASQPRGEGVEDVVGQVLGLGQKDHRCIELALGRIHAKMAALGEAGVQRGLIAGVPAPAMSFGQAAQQVVGGQTGQQHRTLE